jgi:hypothetical protein
MNDVFGVVSRTMLAQDARWISDCMLSASRTSGVGGVIPMLLLGHAARIAYEGSRLIASPEAWYGVPTLAELLRNEHAETIARARHASKLLDDNKKNLDDLVGEMDDYRVTHRAAYSGNAVWFARWLEPDLGMYTLDRRVLGATIPLQFRFGLPATVSVTEMGPIMRRTAVELGGALVVMSAAAGDPPWAEATIDFLQVAEIRSVDRRLSRYVAGRYDDRMTIGMKLLLLMLEGEIATARAVLPLAAETHPDAVFRARLISMTHATRGLDLIAARSASGQPGGRMFADSEQAELLFSPGFRKLRNVSMHYDIRDRAAEIDPTSPMFGLVEHFCPGFAFEEVDQILGEAIDRVADFLASWRRRRHALT